MNILHREVEPQSVPGIAGVWPHIQVIFKLIDEVHSPEVPRLEYRVKTEMSLLCFPRMSWWSHHHLLYIAQSSLVVTVIRI